MGLLDDINLAGGDTSWAQAHIPKLKRKGSHSMKYELGWTNKSLSPGSVVKWISFGLVGRIKLYFKSLSSSRTQKYLCSFHISIRQLFVALDAGEIKIWSNKRRVGRFFDLVEFLFGFHQLQTRSTWPDGCREKKKPKSSFFWEPRFAKIVLNLSRSLGLSVG